MTLDWVIPSIPGILTNIDNLSLKDKPKHLQQIVLWSLIKAHDLKTMEVTWINNLCTKLQLKQVYQ